MWMGTYSAYCMRRIGSIPGKCPVDVRANGPLFCILLIRQCCYRQTMQRIIALCCYYALGFTV